MFDRAFNALAQRPLHRTAQWLHARGVRADAVTVAGFAVGLLALPLIATGHPLWALAAMAANRLGDGLDGALARLGTPTDRGAFLVFFLVFVVQIGTLVQHLVSRRWPRPPRAPNVSQSFNWTSWAAGVAAGVVLGALLSGITPFKPGQAMAMALIACVAGSMGHLVMKALKRDRGVPNWGAQGHSVTGASGLLDRVDALCFAAPVFFHSVRWYFGA